MSGTLGMYSAPDVGTTLTAGAKLSSFRNCRAPLEFEYCGSPIGWVSGDYPKEDKSHFIQFLTPIFMKERENG
jgi:hypothetical protein